MTKDARRTLAAFTVLMGALCVLPPGKSRAQQSPDAETVKKLNEADQRILDLLRKELEKPETRDFDVRGRAERLGRDPGAIIAFVQKEIRFEPYPGIQRGPAGVLVSGAGNALDKAFLLQELLRAAGHEARMTRATLTRERAVAAVQGALEAIRKRPADRFTGPFGQGPASKGTFEEDCRKVGASPDEMKRLSRKLEDALERSWNGITQVSARDQEFLQAQIEAAKLNPPREPILEDLLGFTAAHARVQWKMKGAAAWTDADPCFSDGASLKAVTPVEGEIDPRSMADRFVVVLTLERKTAGDRKTQEVLRHEAVACDTLLEPLQFSIVPTDPKLPAPGEQVTPSGVYKTLSEYREFVAAVMAGDRSVASMVFDYDGNISKPTVAAGKIGRGAAGTAAQAADLFNPGKNAEKTALESLWVDLSATREGKTLWKQRRVLLNPGEQATWCPLLQWNLFLQSHEVSSAFVRYQHWAHRVGNADLVRGVEEWARAGGKGDSMKVLQTHGYPYPLELLDFARARQSFGESRFGNRNWMYFDRPNLFISGQTARLRGAPDKMCLCHAIDIVENGVLEVDAETARIDGAGTSALGVFDSVLEQSMVANVNRSEGVFGTVAFFERARAQSRPIQFVAARNAKGLADAGVPRADAEWIVAHAEDGTYVLVAAPDSQKADGMYAWWSYDPRSGRTTGRISGGRGGAQALWALQHAEESFILTWSSRILCAITALIQAAFHGVEKGAEGAAVCVAWGGAASSIGGSIGELLEVLHMVVDFFELRHAPH